MKAHKVRCIIIHLIIDAESHFKLNYVNHLFSHRWGYQGCLHCQVQKKLILGIESILQTHGAFLAYMEDTIPKVTLCGHQVRGFEDLGQTMRTAMGTGSQWPPQANPNDIMSNEAAHKLLIEWFASNDIQLFIEDKEEYSGMVLF